MARHRISDNQILAQLPAAIARAERSRRTEPHADSVRYDPTSGLVHVNLTNGCAFAIPAERVAALAGASRDDLARVEVGVGGVDLRWPSLDTDVEVATLAELVFGRRVLMRAAAAAGGASRSQAKAEAARRNGLKGGRPPKRKGRGR